MLDFKSEFLYTLSERGFFYQGTNVEKLDELCSRGTITGYIGFDATAKSLQVGNLSAIMLLRWLQKFGHTPVILLGGGTSRIGDPSFRNIARPIMSVEQIQENINGIAKVFAKLINLESGANKGVVVNNLDWLGGLKYIDFLRDYGCHFTVNRMLSFDSIRSRLEKEEPLSFLEFNYMIMQAYDFYYLYKNYNCVLQMGGSDQWGNIVNGIDLTKRLSGEDVFGLTAPLVTDASGVKMGKTREGAVWLNPEMLSPFEYWQFWRNTDDQDVIRFLQKFTELPMEEIRKLSSLQGEEINESKKVLADEATALLHGRDVLDEIHETAKSLFGGGSGSSNAIPCFFYEKSELPAGIGDLFVFTGLCDSKSSFKRAVEGKGVSFQSEIITDPGLIVNESHFATEDGVLLSFGKKKHVRVKFR
jgi:tyrosyl-tRNA synthetase